MLDSGPENESVTLSGCSGTRSLEASGGVGRKNSEKMTNNKRVSPIMQALSQALGYEFFLSRGSDANARCADAG